MALSVDVAVRCQVSLPEPGSPGVIERVVRQTLVAEGQVGPWEINVILVGDDELQELHRRFMDIDEPTDVMTFPFGDGALGGEIVISVDTAAGQAGIFGHTPWEEVRYLAVHGVLHLCGWVDETDEQRVRMLSRQDEVLKELAP